MRNWLPILMFALVPVFNVYADTPVPRIPILPQSEAPPSIAPDNLTLCERIVFRERLLSTDKGRACEGIDQDYALVDGPAQGYRNTLRELMMHCGRDLTPVMKTEILSSNIDEVRDGIAFWFTFRLNSMVREADVVSTVVQMLKASEPIEEWSESERKFIYYTAIKGVIGSGRLPDLQKCLKERSDFAEFDTYMERWWELDRIYQTWLRH